MDLLYEQEATLDLFSSPCHLAASVLASLIMMFIDKANPNMFITFGILSESFILLQVAAYVITVPNQRPEFPVLPWGNKFLFPIKFFL